MLRALTLRSKLFGIVLFMSGALVLGGSFGIFSLRQSARDTELMFSTTLQPLMDLEAMGRNLAGIRSAARSFGPAAEPKPSARTRRAA